MSRQLDSLLKGLSMFSEGVSTAMQNKAIGDATNQAEQIALSTELDAEERVDQLDALASTLRLKLMQRGASASKAETAGASIGLTPAQRATLDANAATQMMKTLRGAQVAEGKTAEQRADFLINAQKDFDRVPGVKKAKEAVDSANTAIALLDAGNPVADQSIKTFMARATGEVGNLTEAEREAFAGSPALARRVDRLLTKWKSGLLTDEDRSDIKVLANTMMNASKTNLKRRAEQFSSQRAKALKGVGIEQQQIMEMVGPTEGTAADPRRAKAERLVDARLSNSKVLDPAKREMYIEQVLKGMK